MLLSLIPFIVLCVPIVIAGLGEKFRWDIFFLGLMISLTLFLLLNSDLN